jgi:cytochrome c oxidase subunit 4
MGIAGAKALVIALGFMHLSRSGPVVILYATAGVFWLGILFLLTFADYLTRT